MDLKSIDNNEAYFYQMNENLSLEKDNCNKTLTLNQQLSTIEQQKHLKQSESPIFQTKDKYKETSKLTKVEKKKKCTTIKNG